MLGLNIQVERTAIVSAVRIATGEDEVPWLSPAEQEAWVYLVGVLMTMPQAIDAQLKCDSGVNFFEYSILVALARDPGMRMTSLAQLTGGTLSRLSHAMTRLERQGWVRREVQVGEVRCTEASLTPAGTAALEAAAPGHVREVRRLVYDLLSPQQVGQLHEICRTVIGVAAPETAKTLKDLLSSVE